MTVKELKEFIEDAPDEMHVVVALLVDKYTTYGSNTKLEVAEIWVDTFGVLNLIAHKQACSIDANLYTENSLERFEP